MPEKKETMRKVAVKQVQYKNYLTIKPISILLTFTRYCLEADVHQVVLIFIYGNRNKRIRI